MAGGKHEVFNCYVLFPDNISRLIEDFGIQSLDCSPLQVHFI